MFRSSRSFPPSEGGVEDHSGVCRNDPVRIALGLLAHAGCQEPRDVLELFVRGEVGGIDPVRTLVGVAVGALRDGQEYGGLRSFRQIRVVSGKVAAERFLLSAPAPQYALRLTLSNTDVSIRLIGKATAVREDVCAGGHPR